MTNQEQYDARINRVKQAIELKIPDRVPCIPQTQCFPYLWAGYTMDEIMYDAKKAQDALKRFLVHFEPDMMFGYSGLFGGQGAMLEKLGINWLQWPGRPGSKVGKRDIFQYIEKPYLGDDEYPELLGDFSGWVLNKWLPRCFTTMECFKDIKIPLMLSYQTIAAMPQFMNPQIVETLKLFAEVGAEAIQYYQECAMFEKEIMEMGFPIEIGGTTTTAFDQLSDTLRGTIDTMADLYEQPEYVHQAVERFYPSSLFGALGQLEHANGFFAFIPLHKGLDGFMSPEQYNEFYWPTLKRLIEDLIKFGYTPLVYTEGKYDSRMETIVDVPEGKCLFHFEDVDMKEAKRIFGGRHCISGGLSSKVLRDGKPQDVRDAVRRLFDIVAVDGGYIFDMNDTIDDVPTENVEALYDEVKTYGEY